MRKSLLAVCLLLAAFNVAAQDTRLDLSRRARFFGGANGQVLYLCNSDTSVCALAVGTDGKPLVLASGLPSWATLGISGGGTNATSFTSNNVLYYNGSAIAGLTNGSTGQAFVYASPPAWGTLGFAGGGTGNTITFGANTIPYSDGSKFAAISTGTSGQPLVYGTPPAWAVLGISGGGTNNSTAYTAGSIIYSDGSKLTQDNSRLFYDATNHWVALGTTTATGPLTIRDNRSGIVATMAFYNDNSGDVQLQLRTLTGRYASMLIGVDTNEGWLFQNTSTDYFRLCDLAVSSTCAGASERLKLDTSGNAFLGYGGLGVGATSLGSNARLAVVGNGITIGGSAFTANASLHIGNAYGSNNRLTQMQSFGNSLDALNLLGPTDSGGTNHYWGWGAANGTSPIWRLQPNNTGSAFSGTTGLNIDFTGHGSFNASPDSSYDLYAPAIGTAALTSTGPIDSTTSSHVTQVANAGTTGTTVNKLAKLTGAPSTALIAATTDTTGIVGIVVGGAGTTGSAQIAIGGRASCVFDGATTAGDYVQISSTTAGDCHDAGATFPSTGQVLGRVLSTNGSGGTYAIAVFSAEIAGSTGGSGTQGGTTSATFVPYASAANTLADSTLSWDNTGKILTTGIGGITFKGSTSGGPTFKSPATGGSVTFTLPSADGSGNQCLATNGSTVLSFINCGGGGAAGDPLTTKGDLWGFTTVDARVAVGADRTPFMADSSTSTGVSYTQMWNVADVNTDETTTSTTFADLTTPGPSLTMTTGTSVLVCVSAVTYKNGTGNTAIVGVAVSGATTAAAADTAQSSSTSANTSSTISRCSKLSSLTAGSNTFKLRYRIDGGATAYHFLYRSIAIWLLP